MPADAYALPAGFLMGASTAAHQIEGGNTASDWWAFEHASGTRVREPSGDAADSYHRWREDMDLLAGLGFNAYRFSVEWARIEPARGEVSHAALAHYRRMVEGARERGLEPVVTLHHFTSPLWFAKAGGFAAPDAADLFARYVETVAPILDGPVRHTVTINEPNMLALMQAIRRAPDSDYTRIAPDEAVSEGLIAAHHAARDVLHRLLPGVRAGWTIANQVYQPAGPGDEDACRAHAWPREDRFIEAARGDDWIGVQSYSRTRVAEDGPLPVPDDAEKTITGWEYYPEALGEAVRHTAAIVGPSVPIIVTENGIATADDARRIDYTTGALAALAAAMRDGVDVRGYLHWSALDNYEWGSYEPTFGLIGVDRTTFARTPKPSAAWLGGLARAGEIPA
ncbi:glycoside hydrolase family 1 protein [Actinomadura verrucosospora]|uniref:Beta-glucosidase n=1 Tax=Actinomadura verrucosospora TaxID=46165 RepID=A0A7D3ZZ09_ACTVE|nr:family 1 glycosylhydrolase [Actinomadura verrucosospora]QKG21764.1 Beta-glucosidase [Actinomadura verrucosospora]